MVAPEESKVPPGLAAPFAGPCRLLVSLDFDGTLREPSGPAVPPEFYEQMAAWRHLGLRWGINTGRSLPYLLEELLPCSPLLPDFICTCERYIYLADDSRLLQPLTAHNAICRACNLALRQVFTPVLHERMAQVRAEYPRLVWEFATDDPLSIEAADSETMDALIPLISPLVRRHPGAAIQRAGRYLRFSDARFSKGTALSRILTEWGVPQSRLFIMGDGQNDLDAFRHFPAAFCAAPSGAHPEVLRWLAQRHGCIAAGVLPALRLWLTGLGYEP